MVRREQFGNGFTLVEILIVVVIAGILASILVTQFSNSSDEARHSGTIDNLRELRSQIDLYRNQHQGRFPGVSGADPDLVFAEQLTLPTNGQGDRSGSADQGFGDPNYPLGPYIPTVPPNPFNHSRRVKTVTVFPAAAPGGGGPFAPGWIYEITSGRIRVNATGNARNGQPYWSL